MLNSDSKVTRRNAGAIEELSLYGVNVLLASGRSPGFTRYFSRAVGSGYPVISLNGALTTDASGAATDIAPVELESAMLAVEIACKHPESSMSVFTPDGALSESAIQRLPRYLGAFPPEQRVVSDLLPHLDRAAMLVMCGGYTAVQDVSVSLAKHTKGRIDRVMYQSKSASDTYYLEIKSWGVNKGWALRAFSRSAGLHRNEIAAIGDYANDMEMCEFAGVAAAMRNGMSELKRHADYVTRLSNDEDGVAEFLEMIIRAKKERGT